jgi:hypothetical protein
MKKIYDSNFHPGTIIGNHNRFVQDFFNLNLSNKSAFLDTTWLNINPFLEKFLNDNKNKTLLAYSGPDWENTICRPNVHNWLKNLHPDVKYIGNSYGEYYFSFWLDFVYTYINNYNFNYNQTDISKVFMNLNRKPHDHRICLVNEIYKRQLTNFGYISLGIDDTGRNYFNLPVPIKLKNDVVNIEGDSSVSGDAGGITNDISTLGDINNWKSYFLNIVSETTVHTNTFISEKTFKPILGYKPFVVLGDTKIYDILHEWGIDTFDDIFGTGYSRYLSYTDRITWIVNIIDQLKNENLNLLYKSIIPRLIKNKDMLINAAIANRTRMIMISKSF